MFAFPFLYDINRTEDTPRFRIIVGCLKGVIDLEYPSSKGQTLLLYTSMVNSIIPLKAISTRVNARAIDIFGRGAIHSALYIDGSVIRPNTCRRFECGSRHQCICPCKPHPHDEHYGTSFCQGAHRDSLGLEQTLVVLLNAKCANLHDMYGLTPSDYARINEEAWMIWQSALQETGYVYDEESGLCHETFLDMF
ncbi:uncharacterized protein Z519_01630 [Cladophialophora bantiana CBS 173.52]|uniref:Uncharacterized protein n=1 Tax=Cladophialophora bantiana (strain ATCC 10958 / CBS 173.52 / CDC B-1940 / NIH 8579) TaxID=1442370 RepID=A0A0D2F7J7_CLAB1|nr:uncharacterized protein Z519_01630 [Cladophialophora bantiana CBS 173.52]KIW98046.1 hypothetical protein Z519_01630 [Cladophialophora bantiana CBS 173.52]